jgi:hypothetical protein
VRWQHDSSSVVECKLTEKEGRWEMVCLRGKLGQQLCVPIMELSYYQFLDKRRKCLCDDTPATVAWGNVMNAFRMSWGMPYIA